MLAKIYSKIHSRFLIEIIGMSGFYGKVFLIKLPLSNQSIPLHHDFGGILTHLRRYFFDNFSSRAALVTAPIKAPKPVLDSTSASLR